MVTATFILSQRLFTSKWHRLLVLFFSILLLMSTMDVNKFLIYLNINQILNQRQGWKPFLFTAFVPSIEAPTVKKPFLADHPYTLTSVGAMHRLPLITSVVAQEGLYPAAGKYRVQLVNKNWCKLLLLPRTQWWSKIAALALNLFFHGLYKYFFYVFWAI